MQIVKNLEKIGKKEDLEQHGNNQIEYFQREYSIRLFSILGDYVKFKEGGETFYLELDNLATQSITSALEKVAQKENNKNMSILEGFPSFILDKDKSDNPGIIFKIYLEKLQELCDYAKSEKITLILGFSSMGGYELLPRLSEIIKKIKAENKDLIFIIGGSDFNALPDKEFLDRVFDYGIDIVNIGGASEFIDFFGKLSKDEAFYRDENGLLKIETERKIPQNIIFENQKYNIGNIKPGEKIETTFCYDYYKNILYFAINNNPCLNNCGYCANYIHNSIPLKDSDIDNAISNFNSYIKQIEDDEFVIEIQNPNPLQYVDKFEKFLQNIDLSKVIELGFFGDFMGMGNKKIYEKVIKIIDDLLLKWPKLNITLHFGIDAIHHKNDGEFVGRTIGQKIALEPKYISGFESFDNFYNRYLNNLRVRIPFNLIFHPNMELKDYKERIDFVNKYNSKLDGVGLYPLSPHPNTQIEKEHGGYFMPEYEIVNAVENHRKNFPNMNMWGYFYLNSSFLDVYIFSKYVSLEHIFEVIINKHFELDEKENSKEKIFLTFLKWCGQNLEGALKNSNTILGKLRYKQRKETIKRILEIIDFTIGYIDFMIYRENYIAGINSGYKTSQLCTFLLNLEEVKMEFIKFKNKVN